MLKFLKKLLTLLILITPALNLAQQWAARYSSATHNDLITDDKSFSITVSHSEFVYVTGYSFNDSTNYNFCTIKYNSSGDTLWTAIYNGGGCSEDKAYAIVVDDQDNVYVTGYSTGNNSLADITTVKYSSNGVQLWARVFNGTGNGNDIAKAICIDGARNVYVTGYVTGTTTGKDMIIIKYDTQGNQLWTHTYCGSNDDIAYAMTLDSQNNVIITGSSMHSSTPGSEDMLTIKVDNNGLRLWAKSYGTGSGEDKAYAIEVDDLDKIIITGYSTWSSTRKDITTIKYYSNGGTQWIKTYDAAGFDDISQTIALTPNNDVIVAGTTQNGPDESTKDYVIIKYDGITGSRLWVNKYDGAANSTDIANAIAVSDINNAVYITGSSKSSTEPGTEDMVTLKLDITTGTALDSMIYDAGGSEDVAYDIAIDTLGNVFITGYTAPVGGNDQGSSSADYLTLKYSKEEFRKVNFIPGSFALIQNYPNPFNPSTTLKFKIPKSGIAKIAVYDILGKKVDILVNQFLKSGDYSVVFNGDKLASGVYFAELTFGNLRDIKKMVLIK